MIAAPLRAAPGRSVPLLSPWSDLIADLGIFALNLEGARRARAKARQERGTTRPAANNESRRSRTEHDDRHTANRDCGAN